MLKIMYLTEEAFNNAKVFLNACRYDWTYTNPTKDTYVVTIFY